MYDKYLVTGATGFLGRAVAEELVRRKAQVHALVLHDDPYINLLPKVARLSCASAQTSFTVILFTGFSFSNFRKDCLSTICV